MKACDLCYIKRNVCKVATHSVKIEADRDHHPEEYINKELDLCDECYAELRKVIDF